MPARRGRGPGADRGGYSPHGRFRRRGECGPGAPVATGVMVLAFGLFYAYCRRVEATWGRGLKAERRIGDLIDHAVAQRGCAFAHDVKEALGGRGNVDHVVMTPAGIWVVETKSDRLSKRRFPRALRQVAENASRVRRHLETSLPVRGALVIADRSNDSLEAQHDWNGEAVGAFGAKKFRVSRTRLSERSGACSPVGFCRSTAMRPTPTPTLPPRAAPPGSPSRSRTARSRPSRVRAA